MWQVTRVKDCASRSIHLELVYCFRSDSEFRGQFTDSLEFATVEDVFPFGTVGSSEVSQKRPERWESKLSKSRLGQEENHWKLTQTAMDNV